MRSASLAICVFMVFSALYSQNAEQEPNTVIKSFSKAKMFLNKIVYSEEKRRKTFYCGCAYDQKLKINAESCGYITRKDKKRAGRVEWEHIVPASEFGKNLKEWKEGHPDCTNKKGNPFKGRNCASKMNKQFQLMQADMYNLVPAIGEINADRTDFKYGIISGERKEYGNCDFEIENKTAEPNLRIRGDIARIFMYMDSAYPGFDIINSNNRALFKEWNDTDPIDADECSRSAAIEKIQKNENLILKKPCEKILMDKH